MSNNKWMDDPVLEGISKERLEVLTNIIEGAKGMEPKDMSVSYTHLDVYKRQQHTFSFHFSPLYYTP